MDDEERRVTRKYLRAVDGEELFDPYQLEDENHDPTKIYAYCGKESASMSVRVPTVYLDVMAALVARREIPEYQTPADMVRDAIHHRIYWYQHHYDRPDVGDQITVFTQMERSKEREKALRARREIIAQLRSEFNEARTQRSKGAMQAVLDEVRLALDSRDAADDTYKDQLLRLEQEFAEDLRSG